MNLIDRDVLLEEFYKDIVDQTPRKPMYVVREQPIIDAIPVDWLREKAKELSIKEVDKLIEIWFTNQER